MEIQGKTAVVTGSASGLGRATCAELVRAGANVVLFDVNEADLVHARDELGGNARYAVVDVADEQAVAAGVGLAMEAFGRLDICINCAGVPSASLTVNRDARPHDLEKFRRVVDVNLVGTFNVLRLCAVEMLKNEPADGERGVVINTSSGAAQQGQAGQAAYSASKAGVEGMALPIARDLARHGIRINTISPGLFETTMVKNLSDKARDALLDMVLSPKRIGAPEDFAQLARSIIENPYLNTACINLDAGIRMAAR